MVLLDRVRRYIVEHRLFKPGDRVVVAVSGGPDSLCLLHLLHRLAPVFQLKLAVAHLDHRFRPEARAEAIRVARLTRRLGLTFIGATADVPAYAAARGLSAQVAARTVRYRFLLRAARRFGATTVAVGHHLNDQVETVLFHFLRGTGPEGLAGMLPQRPLGAVRLIRPLLGIPRAQIETYCRRCHLEPSLDTSNLKPIYTRNRLRLELIPHLEERYNPRLAEALFRLSFLAAADREYLHRQARQVFHKLVRRGSHRIILPASKLLALPGALRGRVARLALCTVVPVREAGWEQVQRLLALCSSPRPAALSLPGGARARCAYNRLVITSFRAEKPGGTPEPVRLRVPGKTALPWAGGWIRARLSLPEALNWAPLPVRAYLDRDCLPGPPMVRARWPGARFHPQGMANAKKLKDFLIDAKVPREERDRLPLVTVGKEIVWVAGLRIAHPYRVTPETTRVLVLELVTRPVSGPIRRAVLKPGLPRRTRFDRKER